MARGKNAKHPKHGNKAKAEPEKDEPNMPIFFYMPDVGPYKFLCQWYESPFCITPESLSYLERTSIEAAPSESLTPPPSSELHQTFAEMVNKAMSTSGNVQFGCAEQYIMFAKALYFLDPSSGVRIMNTSDPKEQKKLGRNVKRFSDSIWSQVRERVAEDANVAKFEQDDRLKAVLLGTGDKEICEAASKDRTWGIGFNEKTAMVMWKEGRRNEWGENLLGKALMRVRERIRVNQRADSVGATG